MQQLFPPLRVLAVDDNRTNLHILKVFLVKLGHDVLTAENGREALRVFDESPPDIVLLDIMMPVMDGFEAARQMKQRNAEHWVPIIFLSALNRDENLVEGLEAGGDDYLTKPINFVVLEAKLRSMQRALHMQQRATEAMRRLQSISDAVMEAIVTIDDAGTIVAGNAACAGMFGWPLDALVGSSFEVLMPEADRSIGPGFLSRLLSGEEPDLVGSKREVSAVRKSGETFPAELGISEIRFDGQRLFIGVIRDIAEQKSTEETLRHSADQLRTYYEQNEAEQLLAKGLLEKLLHRTGLNHPRLRYAVIAADHFSGDIVAATQSSEGRFYALLADATGHGLAAAISVLPVLALFYRLSASDLPLEQVVREINSQLLETMPVGRFVAASLICIDEAKGAGEIWVGGTPKALLLGPRGELLRSFESTQLPLGVAPMQAEEGRPEAFSLMDSCQLVLASDGLFEAEHPGGGQFGAQGLLDAVAEVPREERFEAIQAALAQHLQGRPANDDVSFMLIDCA